MVAVTILQSIYIYTAKYIYILPGQVMQGELERGMMKRSKGSAEIIRKPTTESNQNNPPRTLGKMGITVLQYVTEA